MEHHFFGKFILSGKIHNLTGLHIGGSTTGIEIGGLDNPVIKDPLTERPYLPGSSMKGKLRAILEWSMGLIQEHPDHRGTYAAYACLELKTTRDEATDKNAWDKATVIARLFGPATNNSEVRKRAEPTRLTIRDTFPSEESVEKWEEMLGEGILTEVKTENALDRVTSQATPRPIERVPAGSDFNFEWIIDVYQKDDTNLIKELFTAMRLLEHSSLGGGGSRGHGQIAFQDLHLSWQPLAYYKSGKASDTTVITLPGNGKSVQAILNSYATIQWPIFTDQ